LNEENTIIVFDNFYSAYYNNGGQEVSLDSIFPEKTSSEFQVRLNNTKNKKIIEKLKEEIKKINDELEKLDSYRLSDIYQYASDIDNFKSNLAEEIKNNPQFSIISFLIRNGYIDESYQDYLTYFYENTITVVEKEYLRNVISGRHNNYDISIKNFDEIFNYLEVKNFKSSNVLNYDLYRYLLYSENHKEELNEVLHQENILDFLMKFYDELPRLDWNKESNSKEMVTKLFFEKCLQHNSFLIADFIKNDTNEYGHIYKSRLILSLMNLVDLSNYTKDVREQVARYIETNQEMLLHTNDYNFDQFSTNLSYLNIKIKEFTFLSQGYEKNVLNYIYKNDLYDICESNVLFFMEQYSDKDTLESEVKHKNYELLNNHIELKSLLDYCLSSDEEFLKYILMYIDLSEGEMRDKPEYIEQLLNNNVVFNHQLPQEKLESDESDELDNDEDIKNVTLAEKIIASIPEFYITYTQDKFNDLSSENREILVNNLVITQKAEVNTEIILDYFSQNEDEDNFLIDFINQNPNFEFDKEIYLRFDDEVQEKFEEYIIQSKKLQKNIRKKVLNATGDRYYEKFSEIGMSESQLEKLTDDNLIEFNRLNLEFFRKEYPSSLANFIWNNIKDYINDERDIRDEEQLLELIARYDLKMEDDIRIRIFLLNNHFDDSNFEYLLSKETYERVKNELQVEIQNIVKKYIRQFIKLDEIEISIPLYESILNANDVLLEHKKEILEKLISDSERQIEVDKLTLLGTYLELLELSDIMKFLKEEIAKDIYDEWKVAFERLNQNEGNGGNGNQDAEVSYSEFNKKLLYYLKKRELISDKSRREDSRLKLFGFRSKQIEFKDILEENNE